LNVWETQSSGLDAVIESFEVSFDEEALDDSGESMYIEDVVNTYSKNLRVMMNETNLNNYWATSDTPIEVGDSATPIHLYGGSEGSIITIDPNTGKRTPDSTAIETLLASAYLGMIDSNELVQDLDDTYMPLVYDAGYSTTVKDAIVKLTSEIRLDGVAILDNGDNTSFANSITARQNDNTYNTYYAALFESFSRVFDVNTGRDMWVTPVYHMSNMIPLNDKLYEIWYASAGLNRGTINGIKELRFNPKLTQRDTMYLNQLNPIVKFSIGYTMWGNLTSQRRPSALQDLNVIRTVLYIKRSLEQYLKFFIFEFNDQQAWEKISNTITPFLESIKSKRALDSYTVKVGATEYEKKVKKCHVNVTLQPNKVIEKIELNLYVI